MSNKNEVITILRSHEISNNQKSLFLFIQTIICLLVFVSLSVYFFHFSILLSFVISIISGLFLCRVFVLQHDACHLSLFTNKTHNRTSALILGFFSMIPSRLWNHIHNTHHGLVGNLDTRNKNPELWTMTVNEYKQSSVFKRILYRFARSVIFRLIITPALWIIAPRFPIPHLGLKINLSILTHNIFYAIILYFIIINNSFDVFAVTYLWPLYIFNFMASIMFYLQHQYENTYWEENEKWDLFEASIHGSSHLKVGKFMAWISGNVGCHHVHHLNTKIPCYKLPVATEEVNEILDIEPIVIKDLFYHLNCVLWDSKRNKLISFKELNEL
tara:strand:+ start:5402 stop:6388 length:987 start_codon:yes stop_codon:yes gene_type:complete